MTFRVLSPFAQLLRQLRESRGWSPRQLAERAGLSRAAIGHLENGQRNPSLSTAQKLAEALGVALAELLG